MRQIQANTPVNINVDRAAGRLAIDWIDGHHTEYAAEPLRLLCPCAFCRGEAGRPGWLDENPDLTADQTRIVGAGLVGGYALSLIWADGHDSGYYGFDSLRANCGCPACAASRHPR